MQQVAARQGSLASTMMANYNQNFAAQSNILQQLTQMYTPIAQAGPDQQGFGAQELAALNTQAGEGTGAAYAKASQALNNQLAAQGGGSEVLPTGARTALKGQVASAAANQLSNQGLAITRANYAQGRQNWQEATSGLNALAEEYNPNAIGGQAQGGFGSAFGMEQKIQEMKNQKAMSIVGGITGLASSALSFGMGGGFSGLFGGGGGGGGDISSLPFGGSHITSGLTTLGGGSGPASGSGGWSAGV